MVEISGDPAIAGVMPAWPAAGGRRLSPVFIGPGGAGLDRGFADGSRRPALDATARMWHGPPPSIQNRIPSQRKEPSMRRLAPWAAAIAWLAISGCHPGSTPQKSTTAAPSPCSSAATAPAATSSTTEGEERTLPGGLKIVDIKIGDGATAEKGMTVHVHYTGW